MLLPRLSIADDTGVADAVASDEELTPAELFPIRARDPGCMAQMRRCITTKTLVRVRTAERTFVGHVAAVSDSGLVSPRARKPDEWAGPTELLAWDHIRFPTWNPLYHAP